MYTIAVDKFVDKPTQPAAKRLFMLLSINCLLDVQ